MYFIHIYIHIHIYIYCTISQPWQPTSAPFPGAARRLHGIHGIDGLKAIPHRGTLDAPGEHLGRSSWHEKVMGEPWEHHEQTWKMHKNAGFMMFYVVFNEILFAGTLRRWDGHGILRYFKKEKHGGEWDITYCNMGISWEITNEREREGERVEVL